MKNRVIANRYKIQKLIGEGGISAVYLAHDAKTKEPVAVKILKSNAISNRLEDIIRFHSEAHTIAKISHRTIIKVYEVGEENQLHYIVMEYFNGVSLMNFLKKRKNFTLEESVEIIIQIAEALDYIHNRDIVHRDLNAGNILISNEGDNIGSVKLIDFGLAQIKEINETRAKDEIAGTFAYMSPEQTGLVKRPVDERSDLYSLGVVFYQLVTNQLPFQSDNISILIHQLLTKTALPPSLLNDKVPKIIEDIILKLLEKDPENRYQSARGLVNDLKKIKQGLQDFMLGLEDINRRIVFKTRLIGREKAYAVLERLYVQTNKGKGGICFIGGKSGIGKSRLVEDFKIMTYSGGGTFIAGKCFSGENKEPYGPFKDALNAYLRIFNKHSKDTQKKIRADIRAHIGDLGKIIIGLNQHMTELIDYAPPLVEIEPDREKQRVLHVLATFFKELGRIDGPVILFVDDLQWIDESSIELLSVIKHDMAKFPFMLIGTYRDDEISHNRKLQELMSDSIYDSSRINKILLQPMDSNETRQFIAGILHENSGDIDEICTFIYQKSKGNPFFSIEILKQLIVEQALFFDARWIVDLGILNKVEVFSDVVNVLIKRISLLKEKEIEILSYAAVIGRKFDIQILFELCSDLYDKDSKAEQVNIVNAVDNAIKLQLLEDDMNEKEKILFAHDRIKEVFYGKLDEQERRRLHNEIASTIEKINSAEIERDIEGCSVLFDLAHHFIAANNPTKILAYAFPAGIKAKETYAYEEAISYFKITIDAIDLQILENDSSAFDLKMKCMEELGEMYLIIGRTDEAIELLNKLLPNMQTNLSKARIYKQICQAYFKKGEHENCILFGGIGLKLLNEHLPAKRPRVIASIAKELLVHVFYNATGSLFMRKQKHPLADKYKHIIWFYYILGWQFIFIDTLNFVRTVIRMFNLSRSKIGISRELAVSMRGYSAMLMAVPLFKRSLKNYEKSIRMDNAIDDSWGSAQTLQFKGVLYQWMGKYRESIALMQDSIKMMQRIGDLKEVQLTSLNIVTNYHYLAEYEKLKKENEKYFQYSLKINDIYGISSYWDNLFIYYLETGDLEKAIEHGDNALKISLGNDIWLIYYDANIFFGKLYIEKGDIETSLTYIQEALRICTTYDLMDQYTVNIWEVLAEVYLEKYLADPQLDYTSDIKKINKFCKLSLKNAKAWPTHYGGSLRVNAKYYFLVGKKFKAEKYFKQSIEFCEKLGRKYEAAKSYYEYGLFLHQEGRLQEAKKILGIAYNIFNKINSALYIKKIEKIIGLSDIITDDTPIQRFINTIKQKSVSSSLIKLNQDIKSDVHIDMILDKIITLALEVTGAQSGLLLMKNEDKDKLDLKISKTIAAKQSPIKHYSETIVNKVLESGETILTSDAMQDEHYRKFMSVVEHKMRSVLCVPIKYKNEIKGVCYLDNPLTDSVFSEENIELLDALLTQAIISIENEVFRNKNKKVSIDEQHLFTFCESHNISKREREIILMLAQGAMNKEIGNYFNITHSTVRKHLNSIYQKTGAKDRDELMHILTMQ